jgi:hypothetical protein
VPIPQTDWAREQVKAEYQEFNQNANVPAAVKFGAEMLGPPQTRTEAGLFLALSVIPGGGKMSKATQFADDGAQLLGKTNALKAINPHTKWLDDLAKQATDHADDFRSATAWGPNPEKLVIGPGSNYRAVARELDAKAC